MHFIRMIHIEIQTPRLILKSITPALIHKWFREKTKEEIQAFFGADEEAYQQLKTMHEQGMETNRISLFYFLLLEKDTSRVLGDCGFHTWNKTHRRAELFYNLKHDSDKAKGFMTEALGRIITYGFEDLALHRIQALAASYNTPSIKLLERYGFTKEGTAREDYVVDDINDDSECYSLLKLEWVKNMNSV